MEENTKKQISRRDAMKLLAAAVGAATIANLPPEWSKPGLETGLLPAHAQTSSNLLAGPDIDTGECSSDVTSTVSISPVRSGISMHYEIVESGPTVTSPASLTGTALTNASGIASLDVSIDSIYLGTVTVTWSFENPADGSGSDSQVFSAPDAPC